MNYKIKAKLDGKRILVNAKFFIEKHKVHEINHAFPMKTTEAEIRQSVLDSGKLFLRERKQAKEQAIVDMKYKNAKSVINNLNK